MNTRYIFSRLNLLRGLLVLAAVAIILLVAPRADRQSFSYELNQPWRYPLLTADYDTPILRDSVSATALRDSIDATFIPFVKIDQKLGRVMAERFAQHCATIAPEAEVSALSRLILETYSRGIVNTRLYSTLHRVSPHRMRMSENPDDDRSVVTMDASAVLSAARAFTLIDSLYTSRSGGEKRLSKEVANALSTALVPNISLDSVADNKFRAQEYLNVNAALGVIKKGQRIVDRGEIITPQVFTNLNTYQQVLEKNKDNSDSNLLFLLGQGFYLVILFVILCVFLAFYRPKIFQSLRYMTFIVSFIALFVVFAIEMFEYFANGLSLVPFALVPIVIMVFCDSRTAIFALLITVLLTSLVSPFPFQFIFTQVVVGMAATLSLHKLSRRSQLLRTALISFFVYLICWVTITITTEGSFAPLTWRMVGIYAINAVILSFAYILIFIIEKIFGFTSLVSLVELSDINTPILRKMAEVAPGTFQHSIQVSTLAAEAARDIGADTLLVRAGALYHDIGKTESPVFFTENQHGVNPHAGLDPQTSAQKIISHVTSGISLANKEKLPAVIKDFISQHHGRSLTKYFYTTALNNAREGEEVDPEIFRYPGPDPQTRETAILMLADCVEAASRSLKDYSAESINALVDKIVDSIVEEGRLKESPISLRDLETVKASFKKRLATIYHSRIAYPTLKNKGAHTPQSKETATETRQPEPKTKQPEPETKQPEPETKQPEPEKPA